jgi:hypothetical protein
MANTTINGLSESTTLAANDLLVAWVASANGTRKIKGENLDKLIFRQRTATTSPAGKTIPVITYNSGVPAIEGVTYENFIGSVGGIPDAAITSAKLAANVRVNPWVKKTANYTAVPSDRVGADTTAGAFTVTLPATPSEFDWVLISDIAQKWTTNNLTIARNSSLIEGLAEDLVCDTSGELLLRYQGATKGWRAFVYGY